MIDIDVQKTLGGFCLNAKVSTDSDGVIALFGRSGSGKTTLVKKLVAALKAKGERVECCAFTHVAAKNIGGCTLYHLAHKHVFNGS